MNNEISYQFDILYNNTMSNQAPGLNSYEKSVFLSKAEVEILKNYFNRKSNKLGEGFEDSSKRHVDFSTLIHEYGHNVSVNEVIIPSDALCILNERIKENGKECVVIPISYEELKRKRSKPYKLPLKNQVWRVIESSANTGYQFIGHGGTLSEYRMRYVKIPNPIMVGETSDYLLNSASEESEKEYLTITTGDKSFPYWHEDDSYWEWPTVTLPNELRDEVIQRAVELAKAAWLGDMNTTLTTGARSE